MPRLIPCDSLGPLLRRWGGPNQKAVLRTGSSATSCYQSMIGKKAPKVLTIQSVAHTPTALASSGSLLETQILRLHPRPTRSESLGWESIF